MNFVMKDIDDIKAGDTIFKGDSRGYLIGYKIKQIKKLSVTTDFGVSVSYMFVDENDDVWQFWGAKHKYLCLQGEE